MCFLLAVRTGPAMAQEPVKHTIVVFGDSLSAGYGLSPEDAFPALLQAKIDREGLPYTVVNAGLSGDTTASGLRRVEWIMKQHVDICLIELGGNDALRGLNTADTKNNLMAIIDKLRAKNPEVTIFLLDMKAPPNLGAEFVHSFEKIYEDVAVERNVKRIPFLLEGVAGDKTLNQQDGIHPTVKGQEIVADNIWKTLREELVSLSTLLKNHTQTK